MTNTTKNNQLISSVLLVGGTHGNELTGVHLVRHLQMSEFEKSISAFELHYLLANPAAIKANKRYLDKDLNRCFQLSELNDQSATNREQLRAKEINAKYGPKGQSKLDFIIDLHTSTANMQTNIVLTRLDAFHLQLAAYLKQQLGNVVITSETDLMQDHHFLESIAPRGIVIEIGPIAQGSLEYPCFEKTKKAVLACFDFFEKNNQSISLKLPDHLEIMSYYSKLHFPLDAHGNICAVVHPNLIGKAYPKIEKGDVIFKTFDGEDIYYQGETTHIAFINEAAYYDQKIALCLCHPIQYSISKLSPIE